MKVLRLLLLLIVVVCGISFAAIYVSYEQFNERVEVDSTKLVEIPRGASPTDAVHVLAEAGMIKYELPLRAYMKLTGAGRNIKAGDYYFPSPISAREVLQRLEEGGQGADKITVIEGWNRWDIAAALSHIPPLKLKNANEALEYMKKTSLIQDLDPAATSLEGYMFPDTYFVYSTSTAPDLIEQMVSQFRSVWETNFAKDAKLSHHSVHDVITVASIIETEAKLPEERPIVASVIYNRLKLKMFLSVDSTIVYASKLAGKWKGNGKVYQSDIDRDSPYNLRKHSGLPPGPVGSPGRSSIQAALNPANTTFLYYVRNPDRNDGAHNFYSTPADFERGVQALRAWEQRQKQKH